MGQQRSTHTGTHTYILKYTISNNNNNNNEKNNKNNTLVKNCTSGGCETNNILLSFYVEISHMRDIFDVAFDNPSVDTYVLLRFIGIIIKIIMTRA